MIYFTISILTVCVTLLYKHFKCKHLWDKVENERVCSKCGIRECIHKYKVIKELNDDSEGVVTYVLQCEHCGTLRKKQVSW